ncbi:MAG TPA: hypothetical protein VNB23_00885, partial [Ramlibacter sp.]|nr:hypothetical protein [Ramlibacter sp.]
VQSRVGQLLETAGGQGVDRLLAGVDPGLSLRPQLERYVRLYERHEKAFASGQLVVGHGDLCFSNILYEQQHYVLKLVDPKGATREADLWTHPLYDLCKISQSVLGDYDFINNGLYSVTFSDRNALVLQTGDGHPAELKQLFEERLKARGHDLRTVRLGEASLFLSMLPLHMDHPNKVVAFALRAAQILDQVEHGEEARHGA